MSITKPPAFQWYPKDILASARVAAMSAREECWYRRAIDLCWLHESLPADLKQLAKIIGKGCTVKGAAVVKSMFVPHRTNRERIVHDRLQFERKKMQKFRKKQSLAGKASAAARAKVKQEKELRAKSKANHGSTIVHDRLQFERKKMQKFRKKQSLAGKASAAARAKARHEKELRAKSKVNHGSTTVQPAYQPNSTLHSSSSLNSEESTNVDSSSLKKETSLSKQREVKKEAETAPPTRSAKADLISPAEARAVYGQTLECYFAIFPNAHISPYQAGLLASVVRGDNPLHQKAWTQTLAKYLANQNPKHPKSYSPEKIGTMIEVFRAQLSDLENKRNGTPITTQDRRAQRAIESHNRRKAMADSLERDKAMLQKSGLSSSGQQLRSLKPKPD